MSDLLHQVEGIASGAGPALEEAMPMVAAVAAQAHGAATDHETRLQRLESLVTEWAPLIAATAKVIDTATAKVQAPTPPSTTGASS